MKRLTALETKLLHALQLYTREEDPEVIYRRMARESWQRRKKGRVVKLTGYGEHKELK